jgi:hypothetical protein
MKYYIMEVLIGTFVTLQKFCGTNIMPELISHDTGTLGQEKRYIDPKPGMSHYIPCLIAE